MRYLIVFLVLLAVASTSKAQVFGRRDRTQPAYVQPYQQYQFQNCPNGQCDVSTTRPVQVVQPTPVPVARIYPKAVPDPLPAIRPAPGL